MPRMPCSVLDVAPVSAPPPFAPKTGNSAILVTLAGFWSSEPATRGSKTWIGPQPRPVCGCASCVFCAWPCEADGAAGVEHAAVVGHRQPVDLA